MLAIFLELDINTMVLMRTTPTHSCANHVERFISILSLGLQGVALARHEMPEKYEKIFKKCNGLSAMRQGVKAHRKASGVVAQEKRTDVVEAER